MRLIAIVFFFFGNAALLLGLWLLLDPNSLGVALPGMRVPFGILLVAYGGFRIYSAVSKWRKLGSTRVGLQPTASEHTHAAGISSFNANDESK